MSNRNLGDPLTVHERILNGQTELMVDVLLAGKTNLHLLRVHVHIHLFSVDIQVQQSERIFVLHEKAMVGILD